MVDARIRHRLIGVLLLIVLGALLTPVIFRSPAQVRVALDMEIPEPPEVEQVSLEPVIDDAAIAEAEQAIEQAGEDVVVAAAEAEESFVPEESPVPAGWGVQVASFTAGDNADALASRLRTAGYNAYIREVEEPRHLYRVLVGPELDRSVAEQAREQLVRDRRFKLDGLVVPWSL